jgi:thioredoxin reductase
VPAPEHHTAIIIGGGPAGLPLAVVLGGWHPHYRGGQLFRERYTQLDEFLNSVDGSLLGMDFRSVVNAGIAPVDLFRMLHHPVQKFQSLDEIGMEFKRDNSLDVLLITQEEVGGLWNNVPENMPTLSPGQWMEFAFYPLASHVQENGISLDVNDLIIKRNLVDYYHTVPKRFEIMDRIHTRERVNRVEPHDLGFLITTGDVGTETAHTYTCKYLIYAVGQRCNLRNLGVPGEDLPFVSTHYDNPLEFPGERVLVVGGGRSADWAATELHDAGKQVHYIMRQSNEHHWRLISDSRHGLPYYARIASIIESRSSRFDTRYSTHVSEFESSAGGGLATLITDGREERVEVDHVLLLIGGTADYSLFEGFPELPILEKHDSYRFQVHQLPVHPHSYESTTIPNLYPGGYLAQGIGLVVIAMHGTTYAIAGDILQKEGLCN